MKIGIVVQRYGLQINGGAELHARLLAEKLSKNHQVSIFTTKAISYINWDNDIKPDYEQINEIDVYRFRSHKKNKKLTHKYYRRLRNFSKIPIFLRKLGLHTIANSRFFYLKKNFFKWLKYQGPYCPEMLEKIKKVKNEYDIFIFFTYLYYPTNAILPIVKEKSLFIPTAHDEKPFYFPAYQEAFLNSKFIMYNSIGEKELVIQTYPNIKKIQSDIAGVGFEQPIFEIKDRPFDNNYFVYIGRVDTSKNIHELVKFFENYNKINPKTKLIIIGKKEFNIKSQNKNIIFTGFISEQEKNNLLYHSKALIIPSKHESLSMVTLEAMLMGKPVIAYYYSEVLVDHIKKSNAGFIYTDNHDFNNILKHIEKMNNEQYNELSKNGKQYVLNNYTWDTIINKFENAFDYIKNQTN